ncbi:molybdopterin molybdotransferase MoeA [Methylocucumis oryzae]|uniref:Molybdopterin molybdenumtransferase n=1 Tax=Methylocucumis oryzae TaxID=1632867 RepID=A0A0F3IMQ6_9GAMM|nr:gephyrin-like molybdotransferase Glp [Methylocucumis oryzae]KJV06844.1 molybdopterin molybdenumtransferase [Methylocucumis oryzae]
MDACSSEKQPLLTMAEAYTRIQDSLTALVETETLPVASALGRVLSADIIAPLALPHYRNAAMDGYAFNSQDKPEQQVARLRLVGTSWAGKPFLGHVPRGACVRIFTGAVVPEGLDSVVMQEHVNILDEDIELPAQTRCYQNIRAAGEDVAEHDTLCTRHTKLTATHISLLTASGISAVNVLRQVNVVYFSSGDELVELGQTLQLGQIYNSNRYLLQALLSDACVNAQYGGVLPDDKALITERLSLAANDIDVIITTGGASVGAADYMTAVLAEIGTIGFWKIAVKPGKPFAFGRIGRSYFFGLPGNPGAVYVGFQQLIAPALVALSGAVVQPPLWLEAISLTALKKSPGREEYQFGQLSQDDKGRFTVIPAGPQGSHLLMTMSKANCLIRLPIECAGVAEGDVVNVKMINHL